ncbi:outer membrane protein [Pseudopontixanthobacter vadosimaris]|uniref:outer membrane protein n=1 Tax=Pseudopontixanthobacter vadosimaris TaxID=2726450 RepID=UPI001474AE05|nr:outer membrane beta-barrel protein [Pseudopontixanthobacter vadosimaris]
MKYTVAILAATSAAAIASPSMAQDTNAAFTGPRVEVLAGFDSSTAGSSIDDDINVDNDQSIEGVAYGAAIGYDVAFGGALVGVEAEYTGSTADTDFEDGDFEGFGFGNVETGRDLYVGARIGVLAQPDLLVYAKGGYTNAKYNLRDTNGTRRFEQDLDADGYRVGAGLEYALSGNSFTKIEYRYSNYSDAEIDFSNDVPDSDRFDIDTDRHQVMVGFGYRF